MTTNEQLKQLTLSIRMTNQAKMLKEACNEITLQIKVLQRYRLRLYIQAEDLISRAHNIQREVIPVTTVPSKKAPKKRITKFKGEDIDEKTLEKIFGKAESKKLQILGDKLGW